MDKKRVLIVEDEKSLLEAMKIEAEMQNLDIITASTGETGVEVARKEKPDLILLDLLLPAMDGFTVLEKLKKDESTKAIPVFILSNLGQKGDKEQGLKMGAEEYIIKATTSIEEIINRAKKHLNL